MRIANNPLSRKIAAHFMSKGGQRLWKEEIQCSFNDEFRKEAGRIRGTIAKQHDLTNRDRNAFSDQFFTHLIMPCKDNFDQPYRNPSIENLRRLCDALTWDFNEIFIDQSTHVKIEDMEPARRKVIEVVSATNDQALITALSAMIDAFTGREAPAVEKMAKAL